MICEQTGKQMHLSRGEASAHLRGLKKQKDYNGHIYHCQYCNCWHVGRPKQNAYKNKYWKQ